ncbi:TPA: hypothetical protein ACIVL7_004486 [Salmonella enterica subsp. enterica serovar Chester]|uniref:Lipoprotein n=1 Tax=Salmonella enterica subsp. enterica serovar Chester TaxID=149386 RepID=A0A5H5PJN3_SALET|nr:hypothetical protein [Salmonella enterica subsp. enterica serovar Chester]EAM1752071.1 hypothetical protein [Salmonella enterica]EBG3478120.1 hypothetical protein [Salmonella enterica subsp. enterica]EDV7481896.1 hypothetical protein [Salmonella enterica subsp. enterica serovar Sandiego]EAA3893271.1 hypothetical protein [Salmonella enterica subsp. enterica serovar Chester]
MKKMLIAVLVILPLASCTVHGNKSLTDENHQTVKLKIIKGKTTQQEILTAFGEPQTRATNDGQEMWSYSSMTGENQLSNYIPGLALLTSSSTAHIKSLDLWFKGEIVERYDFRQTASKTSRGLMD